MPSIDCSNCETEFDVDLSLLERESNGSSGNHTSSFTYTGAARCPHCQYENEVSFLTDELDDTGEILSIEFN